MRSIVAAVSLALAGGLPGVAASAEPADAALAKLQGVWVLTDVSGGDPSRPKAGGPKLRFRITGSMIQFEGKTGWVDYLKIKLIPGETPPALDLTQPESARLPTPVKAPPFVVRGRYSVDGDILKMGWALPNQPRPKDLNPVPSKPPIRKPGQPTVKGDPGVRVLTYRRDTK